MPVLNWQTPSAQLDAQTTLRRLGPRISIEVAVHPTVHKVLLDSGQNVPSPVTGTALVDTGASISAIDIAAASRLGLQTIGKQKLGCAAGATEADTFSFTIRILPNGPNLYCVPGVGADIIGQGIIALIGMDLLGQGVLIVNGTTAAFSWSY